MSAFSKAITELIAASTRPMGWDDTQEAARAVHGLLPEVLTIDEINEELRRLREPVAAVEIPSAAILALTCGALVEWGGNPQHTAGAIADRLPECMSAALVYVGACIKHADDAAKESARAEGKSPDEARYEGDPVADFGDAVREGYVEESNAFWALDPLALGMIAHLSRSAGVRADARRDHPDLLEMALGLKPYHERAGFLATMLQVLDHEELLVLHPAERKGYVIEMSGVATNFELFILLADALIGDPAEGWLPGEKPDPRAAAACRDQPVDPAADTTVGQFNLFNWTALRTDGTLPGESQSAGMEHWVWMEGVPADIRPFDGRRVVLLAPPPYARIIQAGRCFRDMAAHFQVTRVLGAAEVEDWLGRIAAAPRVREA